MVGHGGSPALTQASGDGRGGNRRSPASTAPAVRIGDDPARAATRVLIPPDVEAPQRPPSDLIWDFGGETMGTTWAVRAIAPPGADRGALAAAIGDELARTVALFSPWERSSEISRFNHAPAGMWAVSADFWTVLDAAMDLADQTDGAVDPTLGALVDLWGFGPPGPRPDAAPVPTDEEIAAARALSGWRGLRLNPKARGVMQMETGDGDRMRLDFNGIAKGHAVDRVSDRLTQAGATSHLVEIGGELKGRGVKPDGQPWWVEVERPDGSPAPRTVIALVDLAMATSGDWRRGFEHDGRRYAHTIDGATGGPCDNGVVQVTVVDPSAMRADALATALTVMGVQEGAAWAEAVGLAAALTHRTADGLVEHLTPAWRAMLDETE